MQDKMKQYTQWNVVRTSYDPLTLYRLIEKTVLGQTEDQHPFATVYNQELDFYAFREDNLSNPHWYKRFNTKVDVGEAIGVTLQHKVLLDEWRTYRERNAQLTNHRGQGFSLILGQSTQFLQVKMKQDT